MRSCFIGRWIVLAGGGGSAICVHNAAIIRDFKYHSNEQRLCPGGLLTMNNWIITSFRCSDRNTTTELRTKAQPGVRQEWRDNLFYWLINFLGPRHTVFFVPLLHSCAASSSTVINYGLASFTVLAPSLSASSMVWNYRMEPHSSAKRTVLGPRFIVAAVTIYFECPWWNKTSDNEV